MRGIMGNESRKIDIAWDALDKRYHIVETATSEPYCFLSAEDIHKARGNYPSIKFEPRLLTHFDTRKQMPLLFRTNHLSVLPKDNGYVIGSFDPFVKVGNDHDSIEVRRLPAAGFESFNNIVNEAMGINYAEACGFIEDFIGEGALTSTVSGRHGGGDWTYRILSKGHMLELSSGNPQIEVDGGYEGSKSLVLIEAKNRLVEEFCLRQLYFPLRAWKHRVTKPIRTIFLAISGSDYYFYEYVFPELGVFHGERSRAIHYIPDNQKISKAELLTAWKSSSASENLDDGITFPQADTIETAMDVISQIAAGNDTGNVVTADYLAEIYGFDRRQGLYYGDTAAYLGFASPLKSGRYKCYVPAQRGKKFLELNGRGKKLEFFSALMERPVFHDA